MRHKSKNKTRPLFTLSLEMTRLVNETRLLLVPSVNSDIYSICLELEFSHKCVYIKCMQSQYKYMVAYCDRLFFEKLYLHHENMHACMCKHSGSRC